MTFRPAYSVSASGKPLITTTGMSRLKVRNWRTNSTPSMSGIKWSVITTPIFAFPRSLRSKASALWALVATWLSTAAWRRTSSRTVSWAILSSSKMTCFIRVTRSRPFDIWPGPHTQPAPSLHHESLPGVHVVQKAHRPGCGSLLRFSHLPDFYGPDFSDPDFSDQGPEAQPA